MSRLRDFRAYGHPLLLIGLWVLLQLATIVWIALAPGEQIFGFDSSMQSILIAAAFVGFFAAGSRVAWWIAIFVHTTGVIVGLGAGMFESGPKAFGMALLQAASLWLIWSGNVELYVQERRRRRLVADEPQGTGS